MADPEHQDGAQGAPGDKGSPPERGEATPGSDSRPLQDISSAMVQIYKDQFGRGPTRVRTHFAGPNAVMCLLEHTFTPAERNLQAMGQHQRLRDIRLFFQYAEQSRFTDPVEKITGRKVTAFISGIDTNADVACELFVLEPERSSGNNGGSVGV